jgi:hypothetical protein
MSAKPNPKPSPRGFDKELAELEALNEALKAGAVLDAAVVEHLRKGLAHRNNFLVSKAARMVADAELFALLPDVLAAYDRWSRLWSSWSIARRTLICAACAIIRWKAPTAASPTPPEPCVAHVLTRWSIAPASLTPTCSRFSWSR